MKINKKHIYGAGILVVLCVVIVVVGILFDKKDCIVTIVDSKGNEIATLKNEQGIVKYSCDNSVISYANVAYEEAIDLLIRESGISRDDAEVYLFKNKCTLETSFDINIQNAIEQAYKTDGQSIEANTAAIVTDYDGNILACFSREGTNAQSEEAFNNYVLQATYAGSTMKMISVYGPAIDNNTIHWSTMIEDSAYRQQEDEDGQIIDWPQNTVPYTNKDCMITTAIKKSLNTVAVKTLKLYGVEQSYSFLKQKLEVDLSEERRMINEQGEDSVLANLALGYLRAGVTVKDMVGYYQIFANKGYYTKPHALCNIKQGKAVVYSMTKDRKKVISEDTAYICGKLLGEVVQPGGTGQSAHVDGENICGKTGTSFDHNDNWFVGYNDDYICAVWYGKNTTGVADKDKYAVLVFRDFMSQFVSDETKDLYIPENVLEQKICVKTGLLATEGCEETATGYYKRDNMPRVCDCTK